MRYRTICTTLGINRSLVYTFEMTGSYLAILSNKLLMCSLTHSICIECVPVYGYILMHVTDVELVEPTFWLRGLELNEDTNNKSYLYQEML